MQVVSAPSGIDLPPGKIDIPSAWRGAEMKANPDRWLISLSAGEIAELENAAESYLGGGKEIADITGVPENTVKSRMRYALERLQQALSEYEEYAKALK